MNKTRVISTSLDDDQFARLMRKAVGIAFNQLNDHAKNHPDAGEREYCKDNAFYLMEIASSFEAPRPDTYAMFEVSTCHITGEDADDLETMCEQILDPKDPKSLQPLNIGNFGFGFGIMLTVDNPENDENYSLEETETECQRLGYNLSDNFWKILRYAKAHGYRCVYFDCDVAPSDDFETFDW